MPRDGKFNLCEVGSPPSDLELATLAPTKGNGSVVKTHAAVARPIDSLPLLAHPIPTSRKGLRGPALLVFLGGP